MCDVVTPNLRMLTVRKKKKVEEIPVCVPCYLGEQVKRIRKLKKGRFHWCGTLGMIVETKKGKMMICPLCHVNLAFLAGTEHFFEKLAEREQVVKKLWKQAKKNLSAYRKLLLKHI